MMMIDLPEYAVVVRTLASGVHPYRLLLPRIEESPAVRRIESTASPIGPLVDSARVRIKHGEGYLWVDVKVPAIMLIEEYYRKANPLDLYLDSYTSSRTCASQTEEKPLGPQYLR
jgi:hypothetical protein